MEGAREGGAGGGPVGVIELRVAEAARWGRGVGIGAGGMFEGLDRVGVSVGEAERASRCGEGDGGALIGVGTPL